MPPAVRSLRSKFEQLASSSSPSVAVVKPSSLQATNGSLEDVSSLLAPRPPAPTGIKRPPPPPPASQVQQPQPLQASTSLRVSPSRLSTSPSHGAISNGSSPAVSPLLRPVPAPPPAASLNGSIRASSPRPPSTNGAGSDTSLYDEIEELLPSVVSLKNKL